MAEPNLDTTSGFNSKTKIFHSLRPPVPLPPESHPFSAAAFSFSLLHKSPTTYRETTFLIDSTTNRRVTFGEFERQTKSLAHHLKTIIGLSKGETAFVLSPTSLQIPILYFALLSLGVVISPSNPLNTDHEIARQIDLTHPSIAFATSATANKIPQLRRATILLDSPSFETMIRGGNDEGFKLDEAAVINQSDPAAVLYSSGTTGRIKGVILTHRNMISMTSLMYETRGDRRDSVALFTVPLFHIFGFFFTVKAVALGESVVLMERFEFRAMLRAIQEYRVTYMPVSPPLVLGMAKSEEVKGYDLSSLQLIGCGGAPLGREVVERFAERFPNVEVLQGYGLTESSGGATSTLGPEESRHYGSAGRLAANLEAKVVDPVTGEALGPGQQGEVWMRGPTIMKGYMGDDEATASTLHPEGWLMTGDLGYFDHEGFLFIVDRLKELIKYKAYQVPPAELEHLLLSHPDIADAAVIPYPDEEAGQIPMAYVVRQPTSPLNEAQVMDFIAKQVAPYKKIRRVAFINSIPKSAAGKILRKDLVTHSLSSSKL